MGWMWWPSPATDVPKDETSQQREASTQTGANIGLSEEQKGRVFGRRAEDVSRDEQAEQELQSFLNSISAQESSSEATTTSDPSNTKTSTPATQQAPNPKLDRHLPDGSINIHPDALYPRTMSCRQAFDEAFYCQSLGGKFNDIYRFGRLQSCSEHWGAFWFCMRTRTLPADQRQQMIREHYAAREARKLQENGGSSEDIWDMRTVGVRNAFQRDPDAEDDGEWPVK